jgi:hypothetical protein
MVIPLQTYIEGLLYTGHQNIQIKVIIGFTWIVGKLPIIVKGEYLIMSLWNNAW